MPTSTGGADTGGGRRSRRHVLTHDYPYAIAPVHDPNPENPVLSLPTRTQNSITARGRALANTVFRAGLTRYEADIIDSDGVAYVLSLYPVSAGHRRPPEHAPAEPAAAPPSEASEQAWHAARQTKGAIRVA